MEFVARDVSRDEAAREELLRLGLRSTPVFRVGEETVVGFDRGKLERLLEPARSVACPGCGEPVPEDRLVPGNRFECENCAGLVIEVVGDEAGRPGLREVPFASCPVCDVPLEVPVDAWAGGTMEHCGRRFRLTCEFGSWALEPDREEEP